MLQVCREQDLLLFLQDHPTFALAPEQHFQLAGVEEVGGEGWREGIRARGGGGPHNQPLLSHPVLTQVSLLPPGDDGASLEKEARRWATRVARDRKNKAHSEEVGAVLPHGALWEGGDIKQEVSLPSPPFPRLPPPR